jgi:hypothetical protein
MMKHILFSVLIVSFVFTGHTADKSNGLRDIKLGFQKYPWMGDIPSFSSQRQSFTPLGYFEANYRVINNVDCGASIGFSLYEHADYGDIEGVAPGEFDYPISATISQKPMLTYGINLNIHLLPIIFQKDVRFIDIYVASKIGGIYFSERNKEVVFAERPLIDYGIYGGIAVYPRNRWGLYYEYGYGNYIRWKAGLILKLKKNKNYQE